MKTILLDSSIYIASLNDQDFFHSKTKEFILQLERDRSDAEIIVPVLIIFEVGNILKKPPQDIMALFAGGEIIELTLDLAQKLIPFFKSVKLKTSDSIITACAKFYSADLISWDKRLIKEAKKLIKAYAPEDYF